MRKRARVFLKILLLVLLTYSFSFIVDSPLQAKSYEISNYDIVMELTGDGDYIITETITYNFLEGQFSWASRDISGRGFSNLEFISLRETRTEISDYQVEEGQNLKVKWEFPETGQSSSFILKYRAVAGLTSVDGKNIIDWNPIGTDWDVPIRDLDIEINLPRSMDTIEIAPRIDLIANENNRIIRFHYELLPPGTYYHLKIIFPEYIQMASRREGSTGEKHLPYLLGGLIVGFLIMLLDIFLGLKNRPAPEKTNIEPCSLSLAELAAIYYSAGAEQRRGVTAEIFSLASKGKIKLISKLKKGAFGSSRSEVNVEIISEENLNALETIIIKGLKETADLKEFARHHGLFKKVSLKTKAILKENGIISTRFIDRRKQILYTSLILSVVGIIFLIFVFVRPYPPGLVGVVTLLIAAFGRLLRAALTPILSAEGIFLQQESSRFLDEKKAVLDRLVVEKKSVEALSYFFAEIEFLVLHRKFNSSSFNKYKKVFKEAASFAIPDWLELDLSDLNTTLDALEIVDVVNYVLISTVFVTASTGTTATGAGAPGSGAGGGGGAAG